MHRLSNNSETEVRCLTVFDVTFAGTIDECEIITINSSFVECVDESVYLQSLLQFEYFTTTV